MVQWVGVFTAKADSLSASPETHIVQEGRLTRLPLFTQVHQHPMRTIKTEVVHVFTTRSRRSAL